jgi:hypothetical protein
MFTKLGKFRRLGPRHIVPHWPDVAHSNDNRRGRRRPAGQCRSPQPVLACHWISVDDGRPECHWAVERLDETSAEEPGGRRVHRPHRFSAKAIGHSRAGFDFRYVALLHRSFRPFVRERGDSERAGCCRTTTKQRRSIAAGSDWIKQGISHGRRT